MSINLLEGCVNPFQSSKLSKLQEFYWLSFEDLFDMNVLVAKKVKEIDIEYITENKDIEYAKKSTIWFELRKNAMWTPEFKRLQDFYGFTLADTQKVDTLKRLGMSDKDILFITGKKATEDTPANSDRLWDEVIEDIIEDKKKAEKKMIEQSWDLPYNWVDEMDNLRNEYKNKFGKFPSKMIKIETLKKKLWMKS